MSIPNVKVMKELAPYNSETDPLIKKLRDEFEEAFGYTENNGEKSYVIDEIISTYIDGKNITDIINSIPQNYNKLLPITFYLLVNDSNIFDNLKYDSDNKTKLYLDLNDKENIYTIYKNMYDPEEGSESLFR